jgi:hypothetical protein
MLFYTGSGNLNVAYLTMLNPIVARYFKFLKLKVILSLYSAAISASESYFFVITFGRATLTVLHFRVV